MTWLARRTSSRMRRNSRWTVRGHRDHSRRVEVKPGERDLLLREAVAGCGDAFKRADEVREALGVENEFREVAHDGPHERRLSLPHDSVAIDAKPDRRERRVRGLSEDGAGFREKDAALLDEERALGHVDPIGIEPQSAVFDAKLACDFGEQGGIAAIQRGGYDAADPVHVEVLRDAAVAPARG